MIELLTDRIGVSPLDYPDRTESGLYLPEQAHARINQGILSYIGPKVAEEFPELKLGQWLLFSGYSGSYVEIEGERLIIMEARYITAIINVPSRPVRGLYFMARDGDYFQADYEVVMELLRQTFEPLKTKESKLVNETHLREI